MARFDPNAYEDVASRIRRFKKDWPDSQIVTELVESSGNVGATRWVVKASIWREKGYERPDSTGWAFEVDGSGMANKTSALENGETSAIGRALANLNYSGDKRASREEMEKVQRETQRQERVKNFADALLAAEKAGDLKKVTELGATVKQQGDGQLVQMAQTTWKRLNDAQQVVEAEVVTNEPA